MPSFQAVNLWRRWPRWLRASTLLVLAASLTLTYVIAVNLIPPTVLLTVDTNPPGGQIWLDGRLIGKAPQTFDFSSRFRKREDFLKYQYKGILDPLDGFLAENFNLQTHLSPPAPLPLCFRHAPDLEEVHDLGEWMMVVGGWLANRLPGPRTTDGPPCDYERRLDGPFWGWRHRITIELIDYKAVDELVRGLGTSPSQTEIEALFQKTPTLRHALLNSLAGQNVTSTAPFFEGCLADPDENVRFIALRTLREMGTRTYAAAIRTLLQDKESFMRKAAIETLGEAEDRDSIPAIEKLLSDRDPSVREAARRTLENLKAPAP